VRFVVLVGVLVVLAILFKYLYPNAFDSLIHFYKR